MPWVIPRFQCEVHFENHRRKIYHLVFLIKLKIKELNVPEPESKTCDIPLSSFSNSYKQMILLIDC